MTAPRNFLSVRRVGGAQVRRVAGGRMLRPAAAVAAILVSVLACADSREDRRIEAVQVVQSPSASSDQAGGAVAVATFAGGCFWCMEHPFDRLDGVLSTTSGYIGGAMPNPTYQAVSAGRTGHAEAVEIRFDPERVSYEKLVSVFWRNIDPLTENRQFCDRGSQYRSAIFVHNAEQRRVAEASKRTLETSGRFDTPVATEIDEAGPFYPAEEYHQNYADKNPIRYRYYRSSCGRDARLEELWGEEAGG